MIPQPIFRHAWTRYVVAVAVVALASSLRIWPLQSLESSLAWLTFYPAVMIVAIYGGISAGLLATALACLTVTFLWPILVTHPFIQNSADWLGMAVFILTCSMISGVAEAMRRANNRLQENEQVLMQYAAIIESSDDAIVGKTLEGHITSWNSGAERMFGYSRTEVLGRLISLLIPQQYRSEEAMLLGQIRNGNTVKHYETLRRCKDGKLIDVSVTLSPIRDHNGNIVGASKIARNISKRKLTEEALRKSEENYRILFESMDEGFCVVEMLYDSNGKPVDYRFVEINPAFEKQTGLQQALGKTICQMVPDHDAHWFELYGDVARTGVAIRFENPATAMQRYYDVFAFRIGGDGSTRVGILFNDISDRKRAEQSLRESEGRYHSLFENMLDGFAYCKLVFEGDIARDFIYIDVNNAFGKLTGLKDVIGKKVSEAIPGILESNPELIEIYGRVALTGVPERFETYVSQLGIWLFVTVYSREREYFVAVFENITERKQAEAELRIAAAAFETHDAIMITDEDANIIKVNRAFTTVTGYSPEEVLSKNPRIMKSGRHDKAFYIEMFEKLLRDGSWEGEIWDKRKSGEIYPRSMTITAVKDARQKTTQYVGIFSDITDRKKNEELINKLAFYDTLTQLPNRRMLNDRLGQAMAASKRSGIYGAIMFMDLDNFKPLNDTHGHVVGDLLLIEVGRRISHCVREMDTVARFGGDEFVVMLGELDADETKAKAEAAIVAEKIRLSLAETYLLTTRHGDDGAVTVEHRCTSSIGVTLFLGHDVSQDDVLKQADMAMYQAKEDGRNSIRFYEAKG